LFSFQAEEKRLKEEEEARLQKEKEEEERRIEELRLLKIKEQEEAVKAQELAAKKAKKKAKKQSKKLANQQLAAEVENKSVVTINNTPTEYVRITSSHQPLSKTVEMLKNQFNSARAPSLETKVIFVQLLCHAIRCDESN